MYRHGIRTLAKLTALSPLTLRAWEARHRVVAPVRDPRGHRLYSSADIRRLLLLARAVRGGHRIGDLVDSTNAQLQRLLEQARRGQPRRRSWGLAGRLLEAVERYDLDAVVAAVDSALAGLPPLDAVQDVLAPALEEVGERWRQGRLSVAQERLLSQTVQRALQHALHQAGGEGERLLCATLSGEPHSNGALLMAYLASALGFRAHFLGPELPPEELRRLLLQTGARAALLGVVEDAAAQALPAALATLTDGLPAGVQVLIGGRASAQLARVELPPACRLLGSCEALFEYLLEFD